MANRSKRQSRKRRRPSSSTRPPAPPPRRERLAERQVLASREQLARQSSLRTFGERPSGPFGAVPVSEIAILAGLVGVVVGLLSANGVAAIVGIVVCALGVLEVTAREHFSGYRSHAALLATFPAAAVIVTIVVLFGEPRQRNGRGALVLGAAPVFALAFWLLRRQFRIARQARLARPPQA